MWVGQGGMGSRLTEDGSISRGRGERARFISENIVSREKGRVCHLRG